MAKLYVVGDSFSSTELGYNGLLNSQGPTPDYDYGASVYWPKQLADKLGVELVNTSLIGTSQDYAWSELHKFLDTITPEDYLVIILTEQYRFWILEHSPEITRVEIMRQYPNLYAPDRIRACELFAGFINRDALSSIHQQSRLGWLAYAADHFNLRKPLVISAFAEVDSTKYPNCIYSKGTLTYNVSYEEIKIKASSDEYNQLIKGLDPRYNHMCKSNHKILVDKIITSFETGEELDLTTGFKKEILNRQSVKDPAFREAELSPAAIMWRDEGFRKNAGLYLKKFGT